MASPGTPPPDSPPPMTDAVVENLDVIAELHARAQQEAGIHQRAVERLFAAIGRPALLYGALAFIGCWVVTNVVMMARGFNPFDPPPFFWLQGLTSISAFLASALVLVTQNRQGKLAERRAQLSLHLELVAERKVAKLIALVEELRRDLPSVQNRTDPEAEMMASSANPHEVAAALETALDVADAIDDLRPRKG